MTDIPNDENAAQASSYMKDLFRNLDNASERVKEYCKWMCPIYNVYILPQGEAQFRAYVFFVKDKDIQECRSRGIVQKIIDCVYEELERAGRGKRGDITVAFEFDSDENVDRNFEGDYMLRLR